MRRLILLGVLVATMWGPAVAGAGWQEDWEQTLKAAREEGKVTVTGPTGAHRRDALTQGFEKKYGIAVEYFAARGSAVAARISYERRAGQYLWDVMVGGATTALTSMIPIGALDPLEPDLILPEVKKPENWRGGELQFVDSGREMFLMTLTQNDSLFVNSKLIEPKEITSYKDLLNPKWKGKIVADDPRRPGPGNSVFNFFDMHPDLGPDFIRALARQELLILRDYQQELDMIGQGKYSILIGTSASTAESWVQRGLPIAIVNPHDLKEGSDINPQAGAVALMNRRPHPNATKIYINWLLSKDGQTAFARATGYISSRLDVPVDHAPWRVPIPGAIKTYTLEAMNNQKKLMRVLTEAFSR